MLGVLLQWLVVEEGLKGEKKAARLAAFSRVQNPVKKVVFQPWRMNQNTKKNYCQLRDDLICLPRLER